MSNSQPRTSFPNKQSRIAALLIVVVVVALIGGILIGSALRTQPAPPATTGSADSDDDGYPDAVDAFPQDSRYHEQVTAYSAQYGIEYTWNGQSYSLCDPCNVIGKAGIIVLASNGWPLEVQLWYGGGYTNYTYDPFKGPPNWWWFTLTGLTKVEIKTSAPPGTGFGWSATIYDVW